MLRTQARIRTARDWVSALAFVVVLILTTAVGSVTPSSATVQDLSILGIWTNTGNGGSVSVTLHTFDNDPALRSYQATVLTPWTTEHCRFETGWVAWDLQGTWPSYTGVAWGKQIGHCENPWKFDATWDMTDPNTGVLQLLMTQTSNVQSGPVADASLWRRSGRSLALPAGPPVGFDLGGGVTLVLPEYLSGAIQRTAKKPTTNPRTAPVTPVPLNRAISLTVPGLPRGSAVFASIDARERPTDPTKWAPLGGARGTAGRVTLPLFSVTKPGSYTVKLETGLRGTYFIKVRAG